MIYNETGAITKVIIISGTKHGFKLHRGTKTGNWFDYCHHADVTAPLLNCTISTVSCLVSIKKLIAPTLKSHQ